MHGSHGVHDQIESLHDFVQGIIGALSPANHDRAFTHGTLGELMFEPVNDEGNPLIHHLVQVRSGTRHFRHHANLKPEKTCLSVKVMRRRRMWFKKSLTDNR